MTLLWVRSSVEIRWSETQTILDHRPECSCSDVVWLSIRPTEIRLNKLDFTRVFSSLSYVAYNYDFLLSVQQIFQRRPAMTSHSPCPPLRPLGNRPVKHKAVPKRNGLPRHPATRNCSRLGFLRQLKSITSTLTREAWSLILWRTEVTRRRRDFLSYLVLMRMVLPRNNPIRVVLRWHRLTQMMRKRLTKVSSALAALSTNSKRNIHSGLTGLGLGWKSQLTPTAHIYDDLALLRMWICLHDDSNYVCDSEPQFWSNSYICCCFALQRYVVMWLSYTSWRFHSSLFLSVFSLF